MRAHPFKAKVDIAILGSGFSGSILAMILQRQGREVILVDKMSHPRFAIGESSTPAANMVLASLADRYDLPHLKPLARYGTWKTTYPQLACGLKRGFSYFQHTPDAPFQPTSDHSNELLVAASSDDDVGDTHWYRADVDAFLAAQARDAGIRVWEETNLDQLSQHSNGGWQLNGRRDGQPVEIAAEFLVDATGAAGVVPRALDVADQRHKCHTHSRALLGHFRNVGSWHAKITADGGRTDEHPFSCDQAAQHHLLENGWMWLLRFDNEVTSAGIVWNSKRSAAEGPRRSAQSSAEGQWQQTLARYPSLQEMFAGAKHTDSPGTLIGTQRLQRRWQQIAGSNWAALPNTAGFIDPLHSTGIAHSMCGVERLAAILQKHWQRPSQAEALQEYQASVLAELEMIDELVAASYLGLARFPVFVACSMLYFAAATTYEERRAAGDDSLDLLCANDPELRWIVAHLGRRLRQVQTEVQAEAFMDELAIAIRPFNTVGLCNAAARNMYRYTVAPNGNQD